MYSDIQRWNRKYRDRDRNHILSPDSVLVCLHDQLSGAGKALDIACGSGQNSRLLYEWGYEVYGIDGSIEALRLSRAQNGGEDFRLLVADLDTYPLPKAVFDLVLVVHYLNRARIPHIIAALKRGGLIFFKTYNQNHLVKCPEFNPEYVLRAGELSELFKDLTCVAGGDPDPEEPDQSWILAKTT